MHLDHRFREAASTFGDPGTGIIPSDLNNGMEHRNDVMALSTHFAHHGVDNEGPVTTNDLEHVSRQIGTVLSGRGAHPDEDIVARTVIAELPEVDAERSEVFRPDPFKVFRERVIVNL